MLCAFLAPRNDIVFNVFFDVFNHSSHGRSLLQSFENGHYKRHIQFSVKYRQKRETESNGPEHRFTLVIGKTKELGLDPSPVVIPIGGAIKSVVDRVRIIALEVREN